MLGCIAFTLCFAVHPFMDQSALAIMNADYYFPTDKPISEKMKDLIRWLLVPDPRERPNVTNVLAVLDNWEEISLTINLPTSALEVKARQ